MIAKVILIFSAAWIALSPVEALAQVITPHPGFHPRYKELLRVNGRILDADEKSVLYATYWPERNLFRYDLESRTHTLLNTNSGGQAQLIDGGGVVLTLASDLISEPGRVVQWDRGEEIDLGPGEIPREYHGNRVVNGRFGVLHIGMGTVLRDFVARTNLVLTTDTRARYLDL